MKLVIYFTLLVLICTSGLNAQSYWSRGSGGNNVDEALDVTKDNSGNIISAGYFTNTANFDNNVTLTSTSQGVPDVFIQKTSPSGALLWAVKAGGNGSDRASAVECDIDGDIYITGFYYGTATFGSITLNSVNGSQDIFIAKLNSAGVFQWAVSAGGAMGDYSYGIAVDNTKNVFITGQFEGTTTFGTQNLTSQTNPQTNLPSFDIFTAKYNPTGVFQWVRQGKAEFNDRGMDLTTDNSGNVYVTGQFSDTITFQNTYNNNIMNAVFIIKYSSTGQEVWFRKAAGSFGIGYGIAIHNNQDLYVTGDYKGTMTFFGTPNNFLTDTYTNRIFLAKYNLSGSFIWAQSDASDNYLSSRALSISSTGDVYLAGEFGCTMNEYSNLYGTGIFNSIGFTDIFSCKYSSAGTRLWERHFGGPLYDKAHGVVEGNNGRPVIAGSFEKNINWAIGSSGMTTFPGSGNSGWGNPYCSDPYYTSYANIVATGFSDAFVCDGIDLSRQPYDYYIRGGSGCLRPNLDVCIEGGNSVSCPDTIKLCTPGYVNVNLHQLGYLLSPYYHFQWQGNPSVPVNDTFSSAYITNSGLYSVTNTSYDGCYSNRDSVYVTVGNMQYPTITDDHGVNFQQLPSTTPITQCTVDTIILTGGNIGNYSYQWAANPGIINSHDSVIAINASGTYQFTLTGPNNCQTSNSIYILFQTAPASIIPKSNMPDTFTVCEGQSFSYLLYDSITNPAGVIPYSTCFSQVQETWYVSPGGMTWNDQFCALGATFTPTQTGTYIIKDSLKIQNLCGLEKLVFVDTIYVIVNPEPVPLISVSGANLVCQGDSILLIATSATPITWNTGSTNDSIYVYQPGSYAASTSVTDTITGCSGGSYDYMIVQTKPDPYINTVPWTGLICPNDSVKVQVNIPNAINYEWHGPMGIIPINAQFIYVNIQGYYHCVVTDADGCILTSNTVEVKQYSTPYLIGQPTTIICPGQTTSILVVAESSSTIQWQAPLFGSSMTQNIISGGTYYCNVTACGITTNCNIQIIQSSPTAVATANGPTHFCPGDSVILSGNSGMSGYTWSPTSYNGQNYTVYEPGTYSLTVTDAYGCSANSNTITVTWDTSVPPPTALGDTVCAGDTAMLVATLGSGTIEWYPSFPSSNLLSNNDTFLIAPLTNSGIYYVTTQNGSACHSIWIPVYAVVHETSLTPLITNDTLVCLGDSIMLNTNPINGATYAWTGPNSFSSALQNPIMNATTLNISGTYSLNISGYGCVSPVATIEIDVIQALPIYTSGNTTLCEGDSLSIFLHAQHHPVTYNLTDSAGISLALTDSTYIQTNMITGNHEYIFHETYYGCRGPNNTVAVTVKPRPWLTNAFSNLPVCEGDSLLLYTNSINGAIYSWSGPNNFSSANPINVVANADSTLNGIYSVSAVLDGCAGDTASVNVIVYPGIEVFLGNDTTICAEDDFILNAGSSYSYYLWNDLSNNESITIDSSGLYSILVASNYGCIATDSIYISVIHCDPLLINVFTPNNDGVNDWNADGL